MASPARPAVWTFTLDEDDDWVAAREPADDENLRLAVETLVMGIASAGAAETYLAAWCADSRRWGSEFSLSTMSAGVERVSAGTVGLVDLYGQFEDCELAAEEFEAMLRDYVATARAAEGKTPGP
jgi:hypothetical protein